MGNIDISAKLLEVLQQSNCFGVAFGENIPECDQCDVRTQCKMKTQEMLTPVSQVKIGTKSKKVKEPEDDLLWGPKKYKEEKKRRKKGIPPVDPNMPDFSSMSNEELEALANKENVEWKDYGNPNITRMRLVMALKKLYKK